MPLRVKIQVGLLCAAAAGVALALLAGVALTAGWSRALCAGLLAGEALAILAVLELYVPQATVLTASFRRGPRGSGCVGLSFDDGPCPRVTARILDTLKDHGAKATFFVLGGRVEGNEKLLGRMASEGHEIGNHGFSHRKMHFMGRRAIREELRRTASLIERAAGRRPSLLRTPHGFVSPVVGAEARGEGLRIVAWTIGVWDSEPGATADEIAERALRKIGAGDILLLHDGDGDDKRRAHEATALALPRIIEGLKARNLKIVSVGQMLDS